jgi:D-serine deaminase-like pyridoxal phosphate-dependent protein
VNPLAEAVADERLPAAVLDLDAFDANAATLTALARGPATIRVATKSLRCPAAMRRLLALPRHAGLLTYSADETRRLAREGFRDLLLAYPVARRPEAQALAEAAATGAVVRGVVDCALHVGLLGEVARGAGVTLRLCLDVDASWRPAGVHVGVRRSPIRSPDDARRVAEVARRTEGVVLDSVMAYEAQVAGLRDHTGSPTDAVRRFLKRRSVPHVAELRRRVVEALRADGHALVVVNGGGTGSLRSTSEDPVVTEVTAGSGYYAPHLFDGYDGLRLRPALHLALAVVRSSDPGSYVTCAGGGVVASGEAGVDRLPVAVWPAGLRPLGMEGWGEVQTPLTGPSLPDVGGVVLARPAKAGEALEHFAEVLVVRGGVITDRWRTYRGLGW